MYHVPKFNLIPLFRISNFNYLYHSKLLNPNLTLPPLLFK